MLSSTSFHGLPAVRLSADDGASAVIVLQGAHVVSWIPVGGTEWLYVSPRSPFRAGQPIRGGVPLVFPQFATYGPLPQHGFARTQTWRVAAESGGVSFRLDSSAETRALWPHDFAAELAVDIGGQRLGLALQVRNTGARDFSFTAALHTYLSVSDIAAIRLDGLAGGAYRDRANNDAPGRETSASMTVTQEVDRVYTDISAPLLRLTDKGRALDISQSGFRDCVIWNPGPQRTANMPDMPPDGYRRMLAVEAATVARPVTLAPGAAWQGVQSLRQSA